MSRDVAGLLPGGNDPAAVAYLLELESVNPTAYFRFTTARRSVTYDGSLGAWSAASPDEFPKTGAEFSPLGFKPGAVVEDANSNNALQIEFDDEAGILSTIAFTYRMWKWPVRVWYVTLNGNGGIQSLVLRIKGETDGLEINDENKDERTATLGVKRDKSISQVQGPSEEFKSTCRYPGTRDPRCGHPIPGTPCARTVTACVANGRRAFFGGFPDAPTEGTVFTFGAGRDAQRYKLPKRFKE